MNWTYETERLRVYAPDSACFCASLCFIHLAMPNSDPRDAFTTRLQRSGLRQCTNPSRSSRCMIHLGLYTTPKGHINHQSSSLSFVLSFSSTILTCRDRQGYHESKHTLTRLICRLFIVNTHPQSSSSSLSSSRVTPPSILLIYGCH